MTTENDKVRPEDLMAADGIRLSDVEIECAGEAYERFYRYRSYRSGSMLMFQGYPFDDYIKASRELFWNSFATKSEDLRDLGLDFSIPFARKETMDFLGRLTSLNVKPKISGDELDSLGTKILQGMYKKWRFHNNEKVEAFWEILYGLVNGTVCSYIGYNNTELQRRYLREYDPKKGEYKIETKDEKYWDDVCKYIVPVEEIYLPKIWERNIQKQGDLIWRKQMDEADFRAEFGHYPLSKYVFPGMRIAEDSLFFVLLGGTGTTTANKIEVLRTYDWIKDEYKIVAGGLVLNRLGKGKNFAVPPMPFEHKMAPFTWGILNPLDEKFAYGLSVPFLVKDPHKILNVSYTMMVERELRAIDPPILTSDLEAPDLIYGQHKVIPVQDVNSYKEFNISEPSNQFFAMMNSLQSNMSAQAQGGSTNVVPSRQPKSAREVMQISNLQQQAMSNAITMYYDIIRQQVELVLKTMFQFYTTEKYANSDKTAIRTLVVSDMPLTLGGVGDMKIKIVKEKSSEYDLFLEGIKESVKNGRKTEIVEVPKEFIKNITFSVDSIMLEPDNQDELEAQSYVQNIIMPMISTYIPAGVGSMEKTMVRHLEKFGENVSDYASDQVIQNLASNKTQQPAPGGQKNVSAAAGNMQQVLTGMKFGSQNNQGLPVNNQY